MKNSIYFKNQKVYMNEHKKLQCIKQVIQSYYNTTNDNGKQIISDLIDNFEMEGLNVDWIKK